MLPLGADMNSSHGQGPPQFNKDPLLGGPGGQGEGVQGEPL